jgi:hypothetical protein
MILRTGMSIGEMIASGSVVSSCIVAFGALPELRSFAGIRRLLPKTALSIERWNPCGSFALQVAGVHRFRFLQLVSGHSVR